MLRRYTWPLRPPTEHPHKLPNLIVKEPFNLRRTETVNLSLTTPYRQYPMATSGTRPEPVPINRPPERAAYSTPQPNAVKSFLRQLSAHQRNPRKSPFSNLVNSQLGRQACPVTQKKPATRTGVFVFKAWQWPGPPPEAAGVRPIKAKLLAFISRAYPTFTQGTFHPNKKNPATRTGVFVFKAWQ